jgi:CheY-like chemotaxis protein
VPGKPTILAVDDTPSNLIALEAVLEKDFNLRFAASGIEALGILQTEKSFDVILLDVQMPKMDGYETATHIKAIAGCEEIPIVFVTAVYNEDPHVRRGYQVGGVDYFTKPFDPDLLRLKVGIYASFSQRAAVLKERERQLRETEELLAAGRKLSGMLESLPVGVLIADVDGRICQSNDEVARICRSAALISNDEYGALLGWWDTAGRLLKDGGPLSQALHDRQSRTGTIEIRCVDGTRRSVLTSASPLFGVDGHLVGAVIVLQDLSESKQIEAELENRITRLVSLGVELESHLHTTS